jgi:hypothetical protein
VSCTRLRSKKKSVCVVVCHLLLSVWSDSHHNVYVTFSRENDRPVLPAKTCRENDRRAGASTTRSAAGRSQPQRRVTALTRPFPSGFNFQAEGLLDVQST